MAGWGLARFGSAWQGKEGLGTPRAIIYEAWSGWARRGTARLGGAGMGEAMRGKAWLVALFYRAWMGLERRGWDWQGLARVYHSEEGRGSVWLGSARLGPERQGKAWLNANTEANMRFFATVVMALAVAGSLYLAYKTGVYYGSWLAAIPNLVIAAQSAALGYIIVNTPAGDEAGPFQKK